MQNRSYFAINTLAPKSDNTTGYFKKVTGAKSDGFVVVDGQRVFVIDIGKGGRPRGHRFSRLSAKQVARGARFRGEQGSKA